MKTEQQLINSIQKKNLQAGQIAYEELSRRITEYRGRGMLLLELLQNVDDAEGSEVDISLHVQRGERYLVISHNGNAFSKKDVMRICKYDYDVDGTKSTKTGKTGFKGIGFLSVFLKADWVGIVSDNFQFCFDESDKVLAGSASFGEYPWMVTPIWLDNPPVECDKQSVSFILRLRKEFNIKQELQQLQQNMHWLLFSHHLTSLKVLNKTFLFLVDGNDYSIEQKTKDEKTIVVSQWYIEEFGVTISAGMSKKLKALTKYECPKHLQTATATVIKFAIKLTDKKDIEVLKDGIPFCTFPLRIEAEFPFLVNAEFLPKNDRTELIEHEWNNYLIGEIARLHFELLARLNDYDQFKYQCLMLLLPKHCPPALKISASDYQKGFTTGLQQIKFIPVINSKQQRTIARVADCHHDNSGFYAKFGVDCLAKETSLVDPKVSENVTLSTIGVDDLPVELVVASMERWVTSTASKAMHISFWHFISKLLKRDVNYAGPVLTANLLWGSDDYVYAIKQSELASSQLYFMPEQPPAITNVLSLTFVHPEISADKDVRAFLIKQGVADLDAEVIIARDIQAMIQDNKVTKQNVLAITKFVFDAHANKRLSAEAVATLRKLPILTVKATLKLSHQCYLSAAYAPKHDLQTAGVVSDMFVSRKYKRDNDNMASWGKFFVLLGVSSEIRLVVHRSLTRQEIEDTKPSGNDYLRYAIKKLTTPQKTHKVTNFIEVRFLNLLNNPYYAQYFWSALIADWTLLQSHEPEYLYVNDRKGNAFVEQHYVIFYLRHHEAILATDGEYYKIDELWHPRLEVAVRNVCPVLAIPPELNFPIELAKLLGMHCELTLADCLQILTDIKDNNAPTSQYVAILKTILNFVLTEDDKAVIIKWRDEDLGCLLNNNNQVTTVSELTVCLANDGSVPVSASYLKDFVEFSLDEKSQLAKLFNMKLEDPTLKSIQADDQQQTFIKPMMMRLFNVMVIVEAHHRNLECKSLYDDTYDKMALLSYVAVCVDDDVTAYVNSEEKVLYYQIEEAGQKSYVMPRYVKEAFTTILCNYLGFSSLKHKSLLLFLLEHQDDELSADWQQKFDRKVKQWLNSNYDGKYGAYTALLAHEYQPTDDTASTYRITLRKLGGMKLKDDDDDDDSIDNDKDEIPVNNEKAVKPRKTVIADDHEQSETDEYQLPADGNIASVTTKARVVIPEPDDAAATIPSGGGMHHKGFKNNLTDDERTSIGRWAEIAVYQRLIVNYRTKTDKQGHRYYGCSIVETTDGFSIINKAKLTVFQCQWYNKEQVRRFKSGEDSKFVDSGSHFDMKLTRFDANTGKQQKSRIIEIKGTTATTKAPATFTFGEINQARLTQQQKNAHYHVYRVFGVKKNSHTKISKYKELSDTFAGIDADVTRLEIKI